MEAADPFRTGILGVAPVQAVYAKADPSVLWQAAGATAAFCHSFTPPLGASTLLGVSDRWYTYGVPATSPRIQVTVDPELDAALSEFAGSSRSRAVRDLAVRGAEALREEKRRRHHALRLLQRIADGEDDRFDFSVSAELHAGRR
jgi:hypothetical protein